MKPHAIGYLILLSLLSLLSGCQTLAALPVTPEITIKIGMKPAVIIQRDEISVEELQ